jgi:ribosomal-protein-alanine N-acetyltransferase
MDDLLHVREIRLADIGHIADYWLSSSSEHLLGMGVDLAKLPSREALALALEAQISAPLETKKSYALIWESGGKPIGHSNLNPLELGGQAHMHLHLWRSGERRRGLGTALVRLSLPFYFEKIQLQTLYCEPYALNPAPNKTLQKLGFKLEKTYTTVPGSLNFEQEVHRWKLTHERYKALGFAQ